VGIVEELVEIWSNEVCDTKVECRKYHVTNYRVTKGVTSVTEWSHHMKSQVTVIAYDKEVS